MSAHQATLDYVNQILQPGSTEEGLWRRYELNRFAEEQGSVNHKWLSLQEALNSLVGTLILLCDFKECKQITKLSLLRIRMKIRIIEE